MAKKKARPDYQGRTHVYGILVFLSLSIFFASSCASNKKTTDLEFAEDEGRIDFELKRLHFEFRSAELTDEARKLLDENAKILASRPRVMIQIEGHCDVRGSADTNFRLGQKRAEAVATYLQKRGVSSNRIQLMSLGKEAPLDPQDTDEAHAKNRRAEFVVLTV